MDYHLLVVSDVDAFVCHLLLTALQIVEGSGLWVGVGRTDVRTVGHTQGGIYDGVASVEDAIVSCAGAIGCNLSASVNAVPVDFEAYAVVAWLGGGSECGALGRIARVASKALAS